MALHARILQGDPDAEAEAVPLLYRLICGNLRREYGSADRLLINDAIEDTLAWYCRDPACWRPARARLDVYLTAVARNKLVDLLRHEERRRRKAAVVVAAPPPWADPARTTAIALELPNEILQPDVEALAALTAGWSQREREFLAAQLRGERRTEVFAEVLGLPPGMPEPERRRAVKRFKDKLHLRLRRLVRVAPGG